MKAILPILLAASLSLTGAVAIDAPARTASLADLVLDEVQETGIVGPMHEDDAPEETVQNFVDHFQRQAECSTLQGLLLKLDLIQSDGVDAAGEAGCGDAPDDLGSITSDHQVPKDGHTRGFLQYVAGFDDPELHPVDYEDFLLIDVELDDVGSRFAFDLDFGLHRAEDLELGDLYVLGFDIIWASTGESILDPTSSYYDADCPDLPPAPAGYQVFSKSITADGSPDDTYHRVIYNPPSGAILPAWILGIDAAGNCFVMPLAHEGPSAGKYVAAGPAACHLDNVVFWAPAGYDLHKKNSPHATNTYPIDNPDCAGNGPLVDGTSAEFTVMRIDDLALRVWVVDYTTEILLAQNAAEAHPAQVRPMVRSLFEPQPATCDGDLCSQFAPGGGRGISLPTDWDTCLSPKATALCKGVST